MGDLDEVHPGPAWCGLLHDSIPVSAASFGVCVSFDAAGEPTTARLQRQGARWLASPEHDVLQSGFRLKKHLSGNNAFIRE
jgi:hypothetical protein